MILQERGSIRLEYNDAEPGGAWLKLPIGCARMTAEELHALASEAERFGRLVQGA